MALIREFSTLAAMFLAVTDHFRAGGRDALRRKVNGAYTGMSHNELREEVEAFALSLRSLGLQHGDRIGIMSENRVEFIIADLACVTTGIVDVSIFTILTPRQIEYIFNNATVRAVICSNRMQVSKLLKVAAEIPTLEHIIAIQDDAVEAFRDSSPVPLLSYSELVDSGRSLRRTMGEEFLRLTETVKPEDLATLIYTSGTTGNPKGVMLTHANFAANISGSADRIPIGSDDTILSYLPLCHSFERMAGYYTCFACGCTIAFAESLETVSANLLEVRPTLMTSVPRGFERIKARVEKKLEGEPPSRQKLVKWALQVGIEKYRRQSSGRPVGLALAAKVAVADKLVFTKIRQGTGGRVRFFVSGGAALTRDVGEFFFGIGMKVIEGYGLTETSPVISVNPFMRPRLGTVGVPLSNIEVHIAEDGEILTRGPHVMKGYYRDPDATAEAIDNDGWLHTGDIGRFDEEGYLHITDRKKHIIVSSGGKNIAPGPIENILSQSRLIDQILLIGEKRPYMTALIVPEFEIARELLIETGEQLGPASDPETRRTMVEGATLAMAIENDIKDLQRDLSAFERVRRFRLLPEAFTVDNGMLTPTLKVRRKVVEERFQSEIEGMYRGVDTD